MTDVQAALGIHQLAKLERFLETRGHYAAMYDAAFADLPEITIPRVNEGLRHARHLYVIQLSLERLTLNRAEFIEALRAANIGTSVHFVPVHLHPFYRERFGYRRGDYPQAEGIYDRIVSLPLYPTLTPDDVQYVIATVKRVVSDHRKRVWSHGEAANLIQEVWSVAIG